MMKNIIWITNNPFSYHNVLLGVADKPRSSGSWLDAAFKGVSSQNNIKLHIVTVAHVNEVLSGEFEGHKFYVLPGGDMGHYDINSASNIENWKCLEREINPDVVHVWGTESRFAFTAIRAFKDRKVAIYMQGVINTIVDNYYSGIPDKYRCSSIRDRIERLLGRGEYNSFLNQKKLEAEMIKMADAVIVENDWCEYQCKAINPQCKVFRNKLPIKDEFYSAAWDKDSFEHHTIFINSGGYPIKGHHILFKALSIVKRAYPDVKVYIPGRKLNITPKGKEKLRQTSYEQYLSALIMESDLKENIKYLGNLPSKDMAFYIEKCNTYVMPSLVENHSSSLIEALVVGSPCISSFVGGVCSLVENEKNCLLYNSLDYHVLAGLIIKVFASDEYALYLSRNTKSIRERKKESFAESIVNCYRHLL